MKLPAVKLFREKLWKVLGNFTAHPLLYIAFAFFFGIMDLLIALYALGNPMKNFHGNTPQIVLSIRSPALFGIVSGEIALSGFIFLDISIDLMSNLKKIASNFSESLRLSIAFLFLASSWTVFLYVIPEGDYTLLRSLNQIRIFSMLCATFCFNAHYSGYLWNGPLPFITILLCAAGFQIRNLSSNTLIFVSVSVSGTVLFIVCAAIWLWYIINKARNGQEITSNESKCNLYLLICFVAFLSAMFFFGANFNKPKLYEDYDVYDVSCYELCFTVWAAVQSIYQSRVIRNELNKYQEELAFKRMFVNYISHEVRTPLNTAIMGLQVLTEELETSNQDILESLGEVRESCDVAVNTINELLMFDKLEGGTLMLEKTAVNAVELVQRTVSPFKIQARQAGITLVVSITAENEALLKTLCINADVNKIAQVIRNLVSNGLKFTPRDGSVSVCVAVVENGKDAQDLPCTLLVVSVKDSGAGISQENQKKLFKEIVQFNPGKLQKGGGSGLGLYISNGIMALHTGKLSVYSQGEGYGCTFTMSLPIYPDIPGSTPTNVPAPIEEPGATVARDSEAPVRKSASVAANVASSMNSSRVYVDIDEIAPVTRPKSSASAYVESCRLSSNRSAGWSQGLEESGKEVRSFRRLSLSTSNRGRRPVRDEEGESSRSGGKISNTVDARRSCRDANQSIDSRGVCEAGPCAADRDKLRIMVVDDTVTNRKMLCRLLKKRCKTCIQAEDGLEAVEKVIESMKPSGGSDPIDLILMDSVMPNMSGPDATKRIREMGYSGFIIGVTGNVGKEDIASFIAHGANAVLGKPFEIANFNLVLAELRERVEEEIEEKSTS